MMKKNYLKPEVFELAVVCENTMLGGSDGDDVIGGGSTEPGVDGEFAGKNRGEWGNVWK